MLPAPPTTLRVSRTNASDWQTALARIPDVKVEIVSEGGSSITSLLDLKNGKSNLSGTLADVAYLAYAGQLEEMPEPFNQLRGLAVIGLNTLHLLVGRNVARESLRDLKGLHVSLGAPGSSTAHITLRMLQDFGIARGQIRAERIPNDEIVNRLSTATWTRRFPDLPAERNRHRRVEGRCATHSHRRPRGGRDADAVSVLEADADSARDVSEPAGTRPHDRRRHAHRVPGRPRRRCRVSAARRVLRHTSRR